ncbi:hypothetical protein Mal48_07170 [Thalassoglobus polymorphus]|uniref:Uncharacterized protein n=1 Tax=Thalassoglobus polymorphus TaxID=2527994 RepID=A0A517QIL2_9PLAN|nr:hypothetical protein Mal48_07170 [Thalassoglobus polymorphus]
MRVYTRFATPILALRSSLSVSPVAGEEDVPLQMDRTLPIMEE